MSTEEETPKLRLADYVIARPGRGSIEYRRFLDTPTGTLFDYVFGAGGVYVRASRVGLHACIPVGDCEIRGLAEIEPYVRLDCLNRRVPSHLVARAFNRAREVCIGERGPREILFYLLFDDNVEEWQLVEPDQIATGASVHPTDYAGDAYRHAIIELHSHHQMDAFWSGTDNEDEQGFRLYAVIGEIFTKPRLRVRVGCYGYFYEVDASEIFVMPEGIIESSPPSRKAAGIPQKRAHVAL